VSLTIELFPCSGGLAEGLRRAGITINIAFDADPDACNSYALNLGHRPVQMDVRDLLRMVRAGWELGGIDLLIADPPCTPWSRAGNRKGQDDERDMLGVTVELIELLRPRAWLIANVPGLDDACNWAAVVKPVIGGMASRCDYCVDFTRLNAADFGKVVPCPLHDSGCLESDAELAASLSHVATELASVAAPATMPTVAAQKQDALVVVGSLARAIRVAFADAATCGERMRCLHALAQSALPTRHGRADAQWMNEATSAFGSTSDTIENIASWLSKSWGDLCATGKLSTTSTGAPQTTIRAILRCIAATVITGTRTGVSAKSVRCGLCIDDGVPQKRIRPFWFGHRSWTPCIEWPHPTHCKPPVLPGCGLKPWVTCRDALEHLPIEELGRPVRVRKAPSHGHPCSSNDEVALTVPASMPGNGGAVLMTSAKHPVNVIDEPANAVLASNGGGSKRALIVDRKPDPNRAPQPADAPARTVTRQAEFQAALEWPWDTASTVVCSGPQLAPPWRNGREGEGQRGHPNAVVLSERAAAILQGFPSDWVFCGKTKRSRWGQIGMAMPPPMAEAVGRSIAKWREIVDQ